MDQVEINAEVLRLIRANDYFSAKNLWKLIKTELPDISKEALQEAIKYIYDRTE